MSDLDRRRGRHFAEAAGVVAVRRGLEAPAGSAVTAAEGSPAGERFDAGNGGSGSGFHEQGAGPFATASYRSTRLRMQLCLSHVLPEGLPEYFYSTDIIGLDDGSYAFAGIPAGDTLTLQAYAGSYISDPVVVEVKKKIHNRGVDLVLNLE